MTINQILKTNDYEMFKKLLGNRAVDTKRVAKIVKSIKTVGYITNPIIVNEKMEVIDGQGRLEALKKLNLPIDYIVVEGSGMKHCISMNVNMENWKLIDYAESFATQGNRNYINLIELVRRFPEFNISIILSIVRECIEGGSTSANVKEGNLTFSDEDKKEMIEIMDYVRKFIPYLKNRASGRVTVIYIVIGLLYKSKICDEERLLEQCEKYADKLKNTANSRDALEKLEEIYNFRKRDVEYFLDKFRTNKINN